MKWLHAGSWFLPGLTFPVVVAFQSGSTYGFAISVLGIGIFLYFLNIFLIHYFIKKRAPWFATPDRFELTAGLGIVPKWVSGLGLLGMGFVPSGVAVALLLWSGLVLNRAA